jgi:hypothetical protein
MVSKNPLPVFVTVLAKDMPVPERPGHMEPHPCELFEQVPVFQ